MIDDRGSAIGRLLALVLATTMPVAAALLVLVASAARADGDPEQLTDEQKAEARAIFGRVRSRLAATVLPGVMHRSVPRLLFRDTDPGGGIQAAILGRDVVALPPLQQRLVSADRDQVRRAIHVLIHEFAHLEQRGYLWPKAFRFKWPVWKREGGARAFAKIVSRRWYGGVYLSGVKPEYEQYAAAVLERLGRRWVMRGQFRKR
ncbi:MAG TPA: hypothetical protein VK919_15270 [Solirubrobacterales bacterium]|nr:hypothetical protein [Solirubrobacterales bacterium]